ncbi:aldo/keto reductase [Candidatus Hydrogenedentota bacterium]
MIYSEYGSTGIEVSAIGFGGMRFEDQSNVDACASLVKASYDAGINYFDTAIHYGKSEELFGAAFKEMQKTRAEKPFYVATKTTEGEPDNIRRDLEISLTRMGLDYIDFYHVWCVMSTESYYDRKAKGALETFVKLKEEGLVKNICISTHVTSGDVGEMLSDFPFEGVLLGYSVMNFAHREPGIAAAAALNRGVVVMNPLGGGLIPNHPERFEFVKTREDETVVEGALRFLINDPRITVALVGLSNEKQLVEAIRAVDGYEPIPSEEIDRIRANLSDSFDQMCTVCQYCDNCPEDVPVPRMMDGYNRLILTGDPGKMISHLRWHWGILPDSDIYGKCNECGACEEACTQKLPIRERLRELRVQAEKVAKERA